MALAAAIRAHPIRIVVPSPNDTAGGILDPPPDVYMVSLSSHSFWCRGR